MKNKSLVIFIGIVVVIGALLWLSRSLSLSTAGAVYWPGTDIQCLQYGHQNISLHIHPTLSITVDGVAETIPANVGISQNCMSEVHTHDASGEIHLESAISGRTFTLADFFAVWGVTLEREGFSHRVTIGGEEVSDISSRSLNDLEQVVVSYTSIPGN